MNDEIAELYESHKIFSNRLDEITKMVGERDQDYGGILGTVQHISNLINANNIAIKSLREGHRFDITSERWFEELTKIDSKFNEYIQELKQSELGEDNITKYRDMFSNARKITQDISSKLRSFLDAYNQAIINAPVIKDHKIRAEEINKLLDEYSINMKKASEEIKKKSIDLINYSEALYQLKEKTIIEMEKERELSRVEVIKNWPIPSAYKFMVYVGLGLITTGSTLGIFHSETAFTIPIVSRCKTQVC